MPDSVKSQLVKSPQEGSTDRAPVPAEQTSETPTRIGRYTVERRLGSGGMADVYLCRQAGMGGFDRQVVVKQIREHLREREDVVFMFLDEARLVAQVNHPNVVQIYDIDEQEGLPYLVMEYVRGLSFETLSKRLQQRGVQYPIDLVAALGEQACAGLHAVHELRDAAGAALGVVHRDISPSNLLLSADGVVKVIDFGVARAKNRLSVTSAGHLKGRAGYVAPEALTDTVLDRRADLFALGVVLYELCTGKILFDRESDLARLSAVLTTRVPPLSSVRSDVVSGMSDVLSRALEIDRGKRPDSGAVFGMALHEVAMQTGRFVTPQLVADWLAEQLPEELRALGKHLTPRPKQSQSQSPSPSPSQSQKSEPTQRQPSPFSTTITAPSPSGNSIPPPPSSVSPVSSMVTSLQLPQWPGALSSILGDISKEVKPLAPLVPAVNEMAEQMRSMAPAVTNLSEQVRLMRRLYWPLVTLFWLFGLGLILLGLFMVIQLGRR